MKALYSLILLLLISAISSKTKQEWKSRSIYQLLTDRFARTQNTGNCNYHKVEETTKVSLTSLITLKEWDSMQFGYLLS